MTNYTNHHTPGANRQYLRTRGSHREMCAGSRWCRLWLRAPPAATIRPNKQLPSGGDLTKTYRLRRPPLSTIYVEVIYGN
jgi:hypothetical protein